ncbi:g2208 [Coccomyxa elongata]
MLHCKSLVTSRLLYSTVNVEVGSFGESITEGSIASISKRPGDAVAEDEVLFQIETDKVTVDVRAPQSGIVESILVKEEDSVTVGQVVAKITPGDVDKGEDAGQGQEAADTGAPSEKAEALEKETPVSAGEAAEAAKEESSVSGADVSTKAGPPPPPPHRHPSIQFPTRRTPEGVPISSLPAEEQKKYLGAPETSAEQPPQPQPVKQPVPQPSFSTGRWYAGRERGTKLSQSRVLTEREMEMIELGGA